MSTFNVGISAGLRNGDGTLVIPEVDLSPLEKNGSISVESLPDIGQGNLTHDMVKHLDAVVLMLERVDDDTFGPDSRLSLVARYGVGYDTVDVPACTRNDAVLAITPSGVRRPVATTVVAWLLALTLRVAEKDRISRDIPTGWQTKTSYNGLGLVGRTLGLIGIGNIGAEVTRLMQPFGMRLIAHDPYVTESYAKDLGVELTDLETVFRESDVLTVHCPLNEETRGIVNADRLALMKPTAYLINTSRGPVVDEAALIDALQRNLIAGAGIDVFEQEPPAPDNPLLQMDQVLLGPHALCFTDQCMAGLGAGDVDACLAVMSGKPPESVVNKEVLDQDGFKEKLTAHAAAFG